MPKAPPFATLAERFSDPVAPASFPKAELRYRNTRWQDAVGMADLPDADWAQRFTEFPALPANLTEPRAMRYHGHQFGVYNPDLGDGRGFLYAQFQTDKARWLDLGTKGTGQTPWSRQGDGRLTLKGGVREVLASTYLEALGVNTSKAFSLVETGEALHRGDEPSPTRSAVLVRLSHSHIRFGTFQRCAALDLKEDLAILVDHVIETYHPDADDPEMSRKAPALLHRIAEATGRMIGQWMAAGFVHGVMNTDNFNVTGETFDFGPYRFLPTSDPNFTAAYFDQQGLYRFGRQPTQGLWALQQLAAALTLLAEPDDLTEALKAYEPAYQDSFAAATLGLLGLAPTEREADLGFLASFYAWMTESQASWPQTFFDWFCGKESLERAKQSPQGSLYQDDSFGPVQDELLARTPVLPARLAHSYFAERTHPETLIIDEIEALWTPIADKDDWSVFHQKLAGLEALREALNLASAPDGAVLAAPSDRVGS